MSFLKDIHRELYTKIDWLAEQRVSITHKDILDCQSFIFHDIKWDDGSNTIHDISKEESEAIRNNFNNGGVDCLSGLGKWDSPFRVFSVELMSKKAIFGNSPYLHLMKELHKQGNADFAVNEKSFNEYTNGVKFMLFYESKPRQWSALVIAQRDHDTFKLYPAESMSVDLILASILPSINKCKYATERHTYSVKYRDKSTRTMLKKTITHNYVHMYPGGDITTVKSTNGGHINFDIKFMVRGHWRVLEPGKMGKNRAGEYNVSNMTWVTEHEKGNKDAPLIKQVRVVHQDKELTVV